MNDDPMGLVPHRVLLGIRDVQDINVNWRAGTCPVAISSAVQGRCNLADQLIVASDLSGVAVANAGTYSLVGMPSGFRSAGTMAIMPTAASCPCGRFY